MKTYSFHIAGVGAAHECLSINYCASQVPSQVPVTLKRLE